MPGSIFIFRRGLRPLFLCLPLALLLAAAAPAFGDEKDKTLTPEEDDFSETPFTEYGEFNEDAEEAAETKFLQYGRLFGASASVGMEGVTGNRGLLWQGGIPLIDFKVHYWFDFNVALDLGFFAVNHVYEVPDGVDQGTFNVSMLHVGAAVKYYFDTKNLSAAISFANPYVRAGFGSFTKNESNELDEAAVESDFGISINAGAGLEFAIKPRKAYFTIEGNAYVARFEDTTSARFIDSNGLADLEGIFYTVTAGFLFTW